MKSVNVQVSDHLCQTTNMKTLHKLFIEIYTYFNVTGNLAWSNGLWKYPF